jgi:hypothetical protein
MFAQVYDKFHQAARSGRAVLAAARAAAAAP